MSEVFRAALAAIDQDLAEIQTRQARLLDLREKLTAVIGNPVLVVPAGTPAAMPPTPAAFTPVAKSLEDAAVRVEQALARAVTPLRSADVLKASKLPEWKVKPLMRAMIAAGRLVRTGTRSSTRYSLPTGRTSRTAAAPGKPADDDSHGAPSHDISAGSAGMSGSPSDDTPSTAADSRPPASSQSSESLAKGFSAQYVETDDVEDLDEPDDDADLDLADDDPDLDAAQAELDAEPAFRKRPGPKPKYKPGTRQLREHADRETAAASKGSWWLRPDADFAAEAERMRLDPKQKKVPGENNIICMNAAF